MGGPNLHLVKSPLDVDRPATATEIRAANYLLAEVIHQSGGAPIFEGFNILTPENQRRILMQVRTVIWSLRHIPDDIDAWDKFAGDGLAWKDRTSQGVWLRYLDIASPMDKSLN